MYATSDAAVKTAAHCISCKGCTYKRVDSFVSCNSYSFTPSFYVYIVFLVKNDVSIEMAVRNTHSKINVQNSNSLRAIEIFIITSYVGNTKNDHKKLFDFQITS